MDKLMLKFYFESELPKAIKEELSTSFGGWLHDFKKRIEYFLFEQYSTHKGIPNKKHLFPVDWHGRIRHLVTHYPYAINSTSILSTQRDQLKEKAEQRLALLLEIILSVEESGDRIRKMRIEEAEKYIRSIVKQIDSNDFVTYKHLPTGLIARQDLDLHDNSPAWKRGHRIANFYFIRLKNELEKFTSHYKNNSDKSRNIIESELERVYDALENPTTCFFESVTNNSVAIGAEFSRFHHEGYLNEVCYYHKFSIIEGQIDWAEECYKNYIIENPIYHETNPTVITGCYCKALVMYRDYLLNYIKSNSGSAKPQAKVRNSSTNDYQEITEGFTQKQLALFYYFLSFASYPTPFDSNETKTKAYEEIALLHNMSFNSFKNTYPRIEKTQERLTLPIEDFEVVCDALKSFPKSKEECERQIQSKIKGFK
ncbi:MAG: hypothetical protein MRY78_10615 [Saprospiraceae bacterium]|nr:hypothetical protein [Saprospiraceae bacterium]